MQADYRSRLRRVAEQIASYRQAIEEERTNVDSRLSLMKAKDPFLPILLRFGRPKRPEPAPGSGFWTSGITSGSLARCSIFLRTATTHVVEHYLRERTVI